ncbi:MAG: hypothetical protein LBU65_13655 [Planctomycetaceae bacterium]|jgi:hypothetical protein|nr:hypothetical protein [Planctomycetaceae bacterium]
MLITVSVFLCAERSVNSAPSDENQTEQVARLNIKASFITAMISDGDGGVFVGLIQQIIVFTTLIHHTEQVSLVIPLDLEH